MITQHPHLAPLAAFELHRLMGVDVHLAHEGRSHLSFLATGKMLTPAPALHAGFLHTACDRAAYAALLSQLRHDEGAVTHDLHVSVMRSAGAGERIHVFAEVVRRGGTLAFLDARAFFGDHTSPQSLLASARITKSMIPA